jgi:hypothetical protein
MKISNYTIGNRTRDLPTCSAVHQPTAPLRNPYIKEMYTVLIMLISEFTPLLNLRFLNAILTPYG